MKAKIEAGEQPWLEAWTKLQDSRYASLDWQPQPCAHVERGPSNNPNIGSSDFTNDARAAYHHALFWALSGKEAHAEKAAEIIDAWSATLESIGNYFMESGQCQETGRDQGHTQMGLEYLANTCETAWIQGIDLYAALDNRLLAGFEYTARYNLGLNVPYEPYRSFEGRYHYKNISDKGRGRLRPMYERVYNHYHNRMELEAPYTREAALKLRAGQRIRQGRRGGESSSPSLHPPVPSCPS